MSVPSDKGVSVFDLFPAAFVIGICCVAGLLVSNAALKAKRIQSELNETKSLVKKAYGLGYMDAIKGCLESNIIKGPITLVASNGPAFFCSNHVTVVVVKREEPVTAVWIQGNTPVAVNENTFIGLSNQETDPEDIAQNQRNWDETLTRIQATSPTQNP